MLFTVSNGDQFLSGAILDPETVYQKTDDGVPFPELLSSRGIVPGVKPHLKVLAGRCTATLTRQCGSYSGELMRSINLYCSRNLIGVSRTMGVAGVLHNHFRTNVATS